MNDIDAPDAPGQVFWPAVSDLMLAIVLILCMVIAAVSVSTFPIEDIRHAQHEAATDPGFALAGYVLEAGSAGQGEASAAEIVKWSRPDETQKAPVFTFEVTKAEPYLQRISFADSVLFPSDRWDLSDEGRNVLQTLAHVIRHRIDRLEQIQIHGHADIRASQRARDNLELASLRANAVFRYLAVEGPPDDRLDPIAGPLMSATSFGANAPAGRAQKRVYSLDQLCGDNGVDFDGTTNDCSVVRESTPQMDLNRRVELWLYYKAGER